MFRRVLLCGIALSFAVIRPALADDPLPTTEPTVREIGQLVLDGVPEIPDRIVDKMNQYMNVRGAKLVDWSPDGGILVSTRFGETDQIHHVAFPMGARRQVTFYSEPVHSGSFGEATEWFLFNRDWGGNEASQMFRFDLRTGEDTLLTDGESQNSSPTWSNSRTHVAWRSTMRNKKDHDIWVMDPSDPDSKRIVLETDGYWFPVDWSPDDSRILVGHYVSSTESYFWVVDVESGELKPVGNHEEVLGETISYGDAVFDAEGSGVFYTSDEESEHRTLRWAKVGSLRYQELTDDIDWSVGSIHLSADRARMAFSVNENGADKLFLMDTKAMDRVEIPLPMGMLGGFKFNPEGTHLAFTLETPSGPGDVYVTDLATMETARWTESEVGGLDTSLFRTSEIVHYPTFDEDEDGNPRMIPAFIYKPEGEGPFPVIVRIHGGPESQSQAWFSYTSQYQVNELGCAVIYPNVRGSSGFGKTYLKLDNGFLREDSVKDIGSLLDWIAEQPDLDETRVGVTGGSYGGYMSLAALTHYSDRLRAGVDIVGISNFVTFLENTADYRRDLRRVEYGDEREPDMRKHLEAISPTNNVDKIDVPLFVIQGANDPRVPASEAAQIVEVVRGKGKEAWYMLARDEGHGFAKKSNRDQMSYALSLFWETYLLGEEPRIEKESPGELSGASQ